MTTTKTTLAVALTLGLLTGCTNGSGAGGGEETSAPTSSPTSSSSSGQESSSVPHKSLEQGHTDDSGQWVVPSHDVAKDAYAKSEKVIRAYVENYPKKVTEPGVPKQVQKYATDEFIRMAGDGHSEFFAGGGYEIREGRVIGKIKPYSWESGFSDIVAMDACVKRSSQAYNADGSKHTWYTPEGDPIPTRTQKITRYHLKSGDNGRTWKIKNLGPTGETC